jgi:hypothetical protein
VFRSQRRSSEHAISIQRCAENARAIDERCDFAHRFFAARALLFGSVSVDLFDESTPP